jgi:chromatin segregation and condensation protein Rec8/ScpA/Scc1 (kleisin family)
MTEDANKPLWVKSPISILFDAVKLQKAHPWDINLRSLLEIIMAEMRRAGYVEFEASGVALLSSAIIFRRKSELLLKLEEPPKPPEERETTTMIIPVALNLPVMVPHGKITISELVQALIEAISTQLSEKGEEEVLDELPPLLEQPDEFMVYLDKHMGALKERVRELLADKDMISFSYIVRGMALIEVIRTFIIILFLANTGQLYINQDRETKEIWIGLREEAMGHDGSGRGDGEEDN